MHDGPCDVDIGVIYTHEREFMTPLLSSLVRSGDAVGMRLVLVDNASADGVAEWSGVFPRTVVLRNERRLTYAENLNRILAASDSRYVLFLNTDMTFDPAEQAVSKLVRFMDAHPECGVSGCRLYHRDGTYAFPARRFQTLPTIAARRLGLERWMGETVRSYLYQDQPLPGVFECDWLSGCLLMARTDAARRIGGFDSGFRKYFEDVDFCLRMARRGWSVMFNGETYAWHWEQRASRKLLSHDAWTHLKSYARWISKWGFDPASAARGLPPLRRAG
jgi:N-acetylglucosaminyl-diphospho-decaprenol L-rhamnosyltransferase